jgi:abequosyltransferase
MTPPPLLSICIPTYKMASFLADLLDTIVAECDTFDPDQVEVVVTDNASPDDTAQVVASYAGQLKRLVYHRHDENIGPDRNFLAAVAAASGRWCWLMGSDDIVEKGAIKAVLKLLSNKPELCGMSLNRRARSFDLSTIIPEDAFPAFTSTSDLYGGDEVFSAISYYIGYLSGQVVHRETWQEVVRTRPIDEYFNAYIHVYVIGEMLKIRPHWIVVKDRLVGWRSGNDSFLQSGRLKRLQIDVVGYEQIAAGVFGPESDTYRAMRDMIATQHLRHNIVAAVLERNWQQHTRAATRRLALRYYRRSWPFWRRTAPLLFAPSVLLNAIGMVRRYRNAR